MNTIDQIEPEQVKTTAPDGAEATPGQSQGVSFSRMLVRAGILSQEQVTHAKETAQREGLPDSTGKVKQLSGASTTSACPAGPY